MKFSVSHEVLGELLQVVRHVVPARATRPIIQCVLLVAERGRLCLRATDLEVSAVVTTDSVDVARSGSVAVPARQLENLARELTGELVLETNAKGHLELVTGRDRFEILSLPQEDFPAVADEIQEPWLRVAGESLAEMLHMTGFAMATEPSRYALNGTLLELLGGELHLVATDGKRLAHIHRPGLEVHKDGVRAIVPQRTARLLEQLVSAAETVELGMAQQQLVARAPGWVLASRLLEGDYPQYAQVIPQGHEAEAEIAVEEFLAAVRRAKALNTQEVKSVRLEFVPDGVTMSSQVREVGQTQVHCALPYSGRPLTIGFNADFLIQMLQVLKSGQTRLALKNQDAPAVFTPSADCTHVIMPLNLG